VQIEKIKPAERETNILSDFIGGRSRCTRGHAEMHGAVARGTSSHVLASSFSPFLSLFLSLDRRTNRSLACGGSGNACSSDRRSGAPRRDCRRTARLRSHTMTSSTPAVLSSCPCHYVLAVLKTWPTPTPSSPAGCHAPRYYLSTTARNIAKGMCEGMYGVAVKFRKYLKR